MADVADTITTDAWSIKLTTTGIDANADKSEAVLDIHDYPALFKNFGYPKRVTVQAARTAGGTDAIEVQAEGTNVSTTVGFTELAQAVASTASLLVDDPDLPACRYWRMHTPLVGAGNTLTSTIVFDFSP